MNDIEVPVSMQVITPIVGGNAGFHYVLLVDSDTFVIKARDNVPFSPGGYAYSLPIYRQELIKFLPAPTQTTTLLSVIPERPLALT